MFAHPARISSTALTVALLAVSTVSAAQHTESLRFRHLTTRDGLSHSAIESIVQDGQGFVWIGTRGGLDRYDGHEVRTFHHDPLDPVSLPPHTVTALLVDRRGVLWVGLQGGGLVTHDSASGGFDPVTRRNGGLVVPEGERVQALFEDRFGTVWIGTEDHGVVVYDPESDRRLKFRRSADDPNALPSNRVTAFFEDVDHQVWIGTSRGVALVDAERQRLWPLVDERIGNEEVRAIVGTSTGELWIGTHESGVVHLDPRSRKTTVLEARREASGALRPTDRVRALALDPLGRLWIGTDGGVKVVETDGYETYDHSPSNPDSLLDSRVLSLYRDRSGVMWVGTFGGLDRWDATARGFGHYSKESTDGGLPSNLVTAFEQDAAGEIYVGTVGGGVTLFDPATGTMQPLLEEWQARNDSLKAMSLEIDRDGRLWVGTFDQGLLRVDVGSGSAGKSPRVQRYRHHPLDDSSLSADGVSSILSSDDGTLWVATFGGGLSRLDPERHQFVRYRAGRSDGELNSDRLVVLYEDSDGILWIGTDGGGLNRFDPVSERFDHFLPERGGEHSLGSHRVMSLVEDRQGDLWIGTQNGGLNRWRHDDRRAGRAEFERLTKRDGLPSNTIYGLVEDEDGNLWMSTTRGLARVVPETLRIDSFDASRGLQGNDFTQGARFRAGDGSLYFGGSIGFNRFDPSEVILRKQEPTVQITEVRVFDRTIESGASELSGLKHDADMLSFDYAALDFTAPDRNRYRYRLVGLRDTWVETGSRRTASFANLAHGDYRFEVQAHNGVAWGESAAAVEFVIEPPPWSTWYAYLFYAVLSAAAVLLALRYAVILRAANLRMQREIVVREQRESELSAQKKMSQTYLDVAEVALVGLDTEGRITLINRRGCGLLGRAESDVLGELWCEVFVTAEERQEARRRLAQGPSPEPFEHSVESAEGERHHVSWRTATLPLADGTSGILCSGIDVTKERELQATLTHAQKMDALGTLAGGVAHDFNNALNAIVGFTQLARAELSAEHPAKQRAGTYMAKVETASERARGLIKRILTFSRKEEGRTVAVADLSAAVSEAVELLEPSLPPRVSIELKLDQEPCRVHAEAGEIHQIVLNLGTNAVHAMGEEGGVLTISTHRAAEEGADGELVELRVADQGSGMDEATLRRVFEPFFTTKEIGEGTGLGLAMVHGIVSRHGGSIDVSSEIGTGTTFSLLFRKSAVGVVEVEQGAEHSPGEGEHVLLVDDQELVAELGQEILEGAGYLVTCVGTPHDALAVFESEPSGFDVLVTDRVMPGMSGNELARRIHQLRHDLPVVLVSAHSISRSHLDDGVLFLEKPYRVEQLVAAVGEALSATRTEESPEAHRATA